MMVNDHELCQTRLGVRGWGCYAGCLGLPLLPVWGGVFPKEQYYPLHHSVVLSVYHLKADLARRLLAGGHVVLASWF